MGMLAIPISRHAASCGHYSCIILCFTVIAVIASFVGHSFAVAPYNERVMAELDISRTMLSSAWAVTLVLSAVWLNFIGFALDRWGAQPVICLGGIALMVALNCFARAGSLFEIMVTLAMLRLSSVETVDFACRHCMNQWFVEHRALAAGVLNAVSSAGFILPALETLSVVTVGWRTTAAYFGFMSGGIIIASSVFLLSRPEDHSLEAAAAVDVSNTGDNGEYQGSAVEASGTIGSIRDRHCSFTLREAVSTSAFWALIFCWMVTCIPWAGINFLLASILKDDEYRQEESAYVYLMLSIFSALSAAVSGAIVDCIPHGKKQLSVTMVNGTMLAAVLTGGVLTWMQGPLGPVLLGTFLGCWEGASNTVSTVIVPDLFGRKHLGAIRGLFMAFAQIASGAGPLIIALAMDAGMHFGALCSGLAVCQVTGILLMCLVPPPSHADTTGVTSGLLEV